MKKTNAIRILDQKKIKYEIHEYEEDNLHDDYGLRVAESLGENPNSVFKTLVTTGKSKKNYTFCIPVNDSLDLKKAAKLAGEKSLELLHVKDLLGLTGYVRGGCTPIGMKKTFKTFIHETFSTYPTVYLSGGDRGIQIELNPNDLTKVIPVVYADIIVKE